MKVLKCTEIKSKSIKNKKIPLKGKGHNCEVLWCTAYKESQESAHGSANNAWQEAIPRIAAEARWVQVLWDVFHMCCWQPFIRTKEKHLESHWKHEEKPSLSSMLLQWPLLIQYNIMSTTKKYLGAYLHQSRAETNAWVRSWKVKMWSPSFWYCFHIHASNMSKFLYQNKNYFKCLLHKIQLSYLKVMKFLTHS